MQFVKAGLGIIGTAVIAGWVAFSVSAPRNVDNMMDQEMESLGGKSINATVAEAKAEADAEACIRFRELADEEWERSIRTGQPADIDHLDRQVERYCK